jgi:Tol biopolymer transport system component
MNYRTVIASLIALIALAVPAVASAAPTSGAVVFSKSSSVDGVAKGGLFAVREGRLNQLTDDPTDTEPSFSLNGTTIAFVRGGDVYSMRADGTGQRQLTRGAEIDGRPLVAPNGKYVLFERRATEGAPRDLYTVRTLGGGMHPIVTSPDDDHEASISPDGCTIAFVRSSAEAGGRSSDDVYSVRPAGIRLTRLTHTARLDEFAPRSLDETIVFSRGESRPGPSAYADIYTMADNGRKVSKLIAGTGSAFVVDASPNGAQLLFRRDQGLWVKALVGPGKARKLTELPDGSETNAVFSSDGRRVAAFVTSEGEQSLVAIDVGSGREHQLAEGFGISEEEGTTLGPIIAWQPVR